ncbi:MAG: carbohydrate ABC transporter permease [Anaerolineaceae bacterium]|nr:MAG: carbohydrate ABC transporter permease [Anaerolineaceae bacterium]
MKSRKISVSAIIPFALLLIGALTMITPFAWMLSTALKGSKAVYQIPPQWIPNPVDWANFSEIWTSSNLLVGIRNSAFITSIVIIGSTISSSMAAFSFAKMDFPGKRIFFIALLSTMMMPGVVLLIPQFMMYTQFKWIDTLYPLIIPASLGNVSMIFFLRQYMTGLSSELIDAAKIDGCNYFMIYGKIFVPLSKSAIAANTIFIFMNTWNDYLGPALFTNSKNLQTVQVAIASLNSYYAEQTDIPVVMAASLIAIIPVLVLFSICQKYFTESFAMTGIKG